MQIRFHQQFGVRCTEAEGSLGTGRQAVVLVNLHRGVAWILAGESWQASFSGPPQKIGAFMIETVLDKLARAGFAIRLRTLPQDIVGVRRKPRLEEPELLH